MSDQLEIQANKIKDQENIIRNLRHELKELKSTPYLIKLQTENRDLLNKNNEYRDMIIILEKELRNILHQSKKVVKTVSSARDISNHLINESKETPVVPSLFSMAVDEEYDSDLE